jgi:thiol-disulfide isomerase/thioredoxin
MKKRIIAIIVLIASAALAGIAIAQYVGNSVEETHEETETNTKLAYIKKEANISDVKKTDGVVNIYMFWGNGCPHCKTQWEEIEELREEYADDFRVYGFEVFYDRENKNLANEFAAAIGDDEVTSVPYTIIGDKSYSGAMTKDRILSAIKSTKKNNYDIYFDKIK